MPCVKTADEIRRSRIRRRVAMAVTSADSRYRRWIASACGSWSSEPVAKNRSAPACA
jgi:hypothetical protein